MYYIEYYGQSFRKLRDVAMTPRGAKCLATQRLEHGMSARIYDEAGNVLFVKEFWSNCFKFGWKKWHEIK